MTNAEEPFARIERLAGSTGLPGIESGSSYGRQALKVGGKLLAALKDPRNMYLPCPLELKEVLLETRPEIYWQTDHYRGWPGLLVRLDAIDDRELAHRLAEGWKQRAPARFRKAAEP